MARVTMVMAMRPCEGRKTSIMFEYFWTAQRAMHSCNSLKSSVAASDFSASTCRGVRAWG